MLKKEVLKKDELTGLYTKESLDEKMDGCLKEGTPGTLILTDILDFSEINRQYGRLAGDRLLRGLAAALRRMEEPGGVTARVGPDVFAMFLPGSREPGRTEQIRRAAARDIALAAEYIHIKEKVEAVTVAAGGEAGETSGKLSARAYLLLTSEKRKVKGHMPYNRGKEENKGTEKSKDTSESHGINRDMEIITSELSEKGDVKGAYLQNYETFKSTYQLIARGLDRSRGSACIMLLTLAGKRGADKLWPEEQEELMELLYEIIRTELRRGDAYTQYSSCQYLLMVLGAADKEAKKIGDRIKTRFAREKEKTRLAAAKYGLKLCYDVYPVKAPS